MTFEQYRKYESDYEAGIEVYSHNPELPVVGMSWYQAAAYCNWLSKEEGIPQGEWCYEIENRRVTKLKEGYLSLTGYRMPTEVEMEYATRAGASTARYYGETDELLPKYAWFNKNSDRKPWPVASKKPNDLGFFDLHGNVWCWCQEAYETYPDVRNGEAADDKEDGVNIGVTSNRVIRGCSFASPAPDVRSASRGTIAPTALSNGLGFRAARTLRLVVGISLPLPP